jgi:hypothetical protein
MTPANDTAEPTTIDLGCTFENGTWRAHRYATHFEVTSLVNAGMRGKSCEVFRVSHVYAPRDVDLSDIASSILFAAQSRVSVESMRAMLADVPNHLPDLKFSEFMVRGVDIPRHPKVEVRSDLVNGWLTETEGVLSFTAIMGRPSGGTFRHDTIVAPRSKRDMKRAYTWVRDNRARLVAMTLPQFRAEMDKIGIKLD